MILINFFPELTTTSPSKRVVGKRKWLSTCVESTVKEVWIEDVIDKKKVKWGRREGEKEMMELVQVALVCMDTAIDKQLEI